MLRKIHFSSDYDYDTKSRRDVMFVEFNIFFKKPQRGDM
jgi:hypothetical protein